MSYASDNDDHEQCAQGDDIDRAPNDFERMCEFFGYSEAEFSDLSGNEQSRVRWNWKYVQKLKSS